MRRISEMIGLPVIAAGEGIQVGTVTEVVLDIDSATVFCLLLAEVPDVSRGVLMTDIYRIGEDAVMLRDEKCIGDMAPLLNQGGLYPTRGIFGKDIITETGSNIGILTDMQFDPATGELIRYVVSDGILADWVCGRKMMPLPVAQMISDDTVLMPESMSQLLQEDD